MNLPGPSMSAFISVRSHGFWMIVIPISKQLDTVTYKKHKFAQYIEFAFHMNNSERTKVSLIIDSGKQR